MVFDLLLEFQLLASTFKSNSKDLNNMVIILHETSLVINLQFLYRLRLGHVDLTFLHLIV